MKFKFFSVLVFALICNSLHSQKFAPKNGTIVYESPSIDSKELFVLTKFDSVEVLGEYTEDKHYWKIKHKSNLGWIFHCPSHDWSKITPWSKLKPQNEPQILSQIEQRNKILDRYSTIGRDINYGDIYRGYGDGYLPFVGYEGKKAIFAFPESNWRSDGIFVEVPGCKSNFTIFMISDFSSNDMENAFKNQNVNCGRGQSYLILKEDKSFFYYYSGSGSITSPETEKSKSMNGKVFKDLISLAPCGFGISINSAGETYIGTWNNGVYNTGTVYYTENDINGRKSLYGTFNGNKLQGNFILKMKNGEIYDVQYSNGIETGKTKSKEFFKVSETKEEQSIIGDIKFKIPEKTLKRNDKDVIFHLEPRLYSITSYNNQVDIPFIRSEYATGYFDNSFLGNGFRCFLFNGKTHGFFYSQNYIGFMNNGKREGWAESFTETSATHWSDILFNTGNSATTKRKYRAFFEDDLNITGWKLVDENTTYYSSAPPRESSQSQNEVNSTYENMTVKVKEYGKWEKDPNIDEWYQEIEYEGETNKVYKSNTGVYFIKKTVWTSQGYLTYNDAVLAAYLYKKYDYVLKRNQK